MISYIQKTITLVIQNCHLDNLAWSCFYFWILKSVI